MFKKILIGGLIAILVGAVAVGAYDLLQGDSALAYRGEGNNAGTGEATGNGQGTGQGNSANSSSRGNRGAGLGENPGTGLAEPQASVDEWITISGIVESIDTSGLTLETSDGTMVVELGRPQFLEEQNIEIEQGDAVEVLGFYEEESFTAGEITLTDSGERIVLRDTSGRPLWAGGTNSSQGGRGQSGTGESQSQSNQGLADGSQEPQPQAAVDAWFTVEGTVTAVELNALTIETAEDETVLAELGPEHYWTAQNIVFEAGDNVSITGFYEDEETFVAGSVTLLESGETLLLREDSGRPLWAGGRGGNQS